jgi:hypothetical protein
LDKIILVWNNIAGVKGYKSEKYNRIIIDTLQFVFHISCNLAKLVLKSKVHV